MLLFSVVCNFDIFASLTHLFTHFSLFLLRICCAYRIKSLSLQAKTNLALAFGNQIKEHQKRPWPDRRKYKR